MKYLSYSSVINIQWANLAKTVIICSVNFDHLPEEYVQFCCMDNSNDHPHVKEIFDKCVAGEFGAIADADISISEEDALLIIRQERDKLLSEVVDPVLTNQLRWNSLNEEKQQEWATYRQALLDLPENGVVVWDDNAIQHVVSNLPTKPE